MLAKLKMSGPPAPLASARGEPDPRTAAKLARLLAYALPHWPALALLGLVSVAGSLLAALQPWPLKLLIDNVLGEEPLPGAVESGFGLFGLEATTGAVLAFVVAGGLVLFALNSMLDAAATWGWTVVGRRMIFGLAGDVFSRLQRRSLAYHGRAPVGETMTRITGDSWALQELVNSLIFGPGQAAVTIAIMIFLMAQLDVQLMMISLVAAPAIVLASRLVGRRLRDISETQRGLKGTIRAHIQQTLTGMPVVQAFAQEEREQSRFERFADSMIRARQRGAVINQVNHLGPGLIAALGSAVVLWLGAMRVVDGAMTIGSLLVFMAYLRSLQGQVKTFARIYPALQRAAPRIDRLDELLRTPPEVRDRPGAADLPAIRGEVAFDNVSFGYLPDVPVLRAVSFRAEPGQRIALVGPTGAGKTTFVSLIPRFFDPSEGRVLIDGHDLRDVRLASLRAQIALVLQEPFLQPLSVADNIAYGRPGASRQDIEAAARAANAHDFIERLPDGYQTVLGERGTSLSGGERQRISIARALLKDAPILILDEPTSALDAGTEALVLEAVRRLIRGRTTFVIAHRLSTVRDADIVVVLDHGRVAEAGPPAELVRRPGLFAKFHALQADAAPAGEEAGA